MVWLKELQLVSGMNRTKSTQSRKVWSTFHAQRISINREPISCTSLFKQDKKQLHLFCSFNWGGGEKKPPRQMKILKNGISTRREEDANCVTYFWGLGIQARGNTRRGAWRTMCFLRDFSLQGGKNGPHNGPEFFMASFWVNFSRHIVLQVLQIKRIFNSNHSWECHQSWE